MAGRFNLISGDEPSPSPHGDRRSPRSIDEYLESAYHDGGGNACRRTRRGAFLDALMHWRYYIIFLALGIANSGDSAEMGCTNFILSSVGFQRDILRDGGGDDEDGGADFAGRGAAIASAHFAGMVVSGLLSGVLADVRGRRFTLLLGLLNNVVVGLLSALARNAAELCLLRFLCGIGLGMVIAGVVTLSAEVSPPSRRGRFMTLVASCYTLGFLYTSFWALVIFRASGSGNWRLFMFINALPTTVAATLVVMFVPESPRFFLCRGQLKEAVHAANVIASRIGCVDELMTEEELKQHLFQVKRVGNASVRAKDAISLHESVESSPTTIVVGEINLWREFWVGLVSLKQVFTNGMYRVTIPIQLTYFSLTLVTGVGTWWTKIFQNLELQIDPYELSFYHTLSQIPGVILASGLIDSVGRRQLVIIGLVGSAVTLMLLSTLTNTIQRVEEDIAGSDKGDYYSWLVLGMACLYTVSLCIGWLSIECLSSESFPTKIRSTGRGVCVATGRLAGFCVQFTYGPLINQNRLSYMLGLASLFAIGGVMTSCKTTDTTNVDLRDHWDYSKTGDADASIHDDENGASDQHGKRASFANEKHY